MKSVVQSGSNPHSHWPEQNRDADEDLIRAFTSLDIPPLGGQLRIAPDGECQTGDEGESQKNPCIRPIQAAG
jgi:hypothetical protein